MKIGKYNIKVEKKETINSLFIYALMFTLFVLFTENSGKQSCFIAACTSGVGLLWKTFWFNYYERKKQREKLGLVNTVEGCDATVVQLKHLSS